MTSLNDALAAACAQRNGYVYYLADPRTPRHPRYVGVTQDPEARAVQHKRPGDGRPILQAWKASLRADGLVPLPVVVSAHERREDAAEREWRLIGRWSRRGLCDLNSGVEGATQEFALRCAGKRKEAA